MAGRPKSKASYIKNTVDPHFSWFIRLNGANQNGMCRCITCNKMVHWTEIDAGHFHIRKNMGTRFHPCNVAPQCSWCNSWNEGQSALFAQYIKDKFGVEMLDELAELAKGNEPLDLDKLVVLVAELKTKIRKLCKDKGLKCPLR